MGRQRAYYWSSSKFAAWLRKLAGAEEKPAYASPADWRDWALTQKAEHPIVSWVTEKGLNMVQNAIHWPMDKVMDVKHFIRARFIVQQHIVHTGLPVGTWYDAEDRMMHALFAVFVEFIETETAYDCLAWGGEEERKIAPWWTRHRLTNWGKMRCPELGLQRLDWGISLGEPRTDQYGNDISNPRQAASAQEQKDLYIWWTQTRPNRGDPWVISGAAAAYEQQLDTDDFLGEKDTSEQRRAKRLARERLDELERQYDQEDEDMMIRLIKIRKHLWT